MTATPTPTTTNALRRVSSLPYQKLNDEVLVVDPRTREVHLLNVTATRIWELLETPHTREQLLEALNQEFDVTPDALRADVETLLADLSTKGLVGADAAGESDPADADGGGV